MATEPNAPSALHQLLQPDGYYTYMNIPCPKANSSTSKTAGKSDASDAIDVELVKKNYRRLSLKHHPDRKNGDPETFRVLNRAKIVLITPKLRKQYDLLGLDLVDEEESDANDNNAQKNEGDTSNDDNADTGNPDSVMSQLASVTLASILQITIRTVLMAIVATLVTRFRITVVPMILFLAFVTFRVKSTPGTTPKEYLVPPILMLGMIAMYYGRATIPPESDSDTGTVTTSTWLYFFGRSFLFF